MRLFLAIEFNEEILAALEETQALLEKRGLRGRYAPPENLHLTLAFIGEYPDPDRVLEVMDTVDFSPFPLTLEGFGRFGDLWWAGLAPSEPLNALVRRLRRALAENNIPFDRKRFSPHITLVRKGTFDGKPPAVTVPRAEMTADRFVLMRSDWGRRGMIYTELGGREAGGEPEPEK